MKKMENKKKIYDRKKKNNNSNFCKLFQIIERIYRIFFLYFILTKLKSIFLKIEPIF